MSSSALLLTSPAFAHPGGHQIASFAAGFEHPVAGWDHVLAMLAIGIWAVQQRRTLTLLTPLAFPATMAFGAVTATQFSGLHHVESGIAVSVAALGLLIAFAVRMPIVASAAVVGLFGFLHGYAHGVEAPAGGSMLTYHLWRRLCGRHHGVASRWHGRRRAGASLAYCRAYCALVVAPWRLQAWLYWRLPDSSLNSCCRLFTPRRISAGVMAANPNNRPQARATCELSSGAL